MNQRLREFDFMRAFAALSVIAIHVTAGFVASSQLGYVWNQAMRFAVPLFIILSGFLLTYVDLGRTRMLFFAFLQKRFKKILLPYVIWTVFYVLYSNRHLLSGALLNDPLSLVALIGKHLVMGTGYVHLYFLLIMLQLYILYPLLLVWLEKWRNALLIGSLIITLVSQTLIYLHQLHFLVLPSLGIPYVSLFPIWLFYFVFGMVAAQQKDGWQEKLKGKDLSFALLWVISFVVLLADSHYTKTFASSIKPSVMLYCLTSYFFFYVVTLRLKETKRQLGKWFDWLSANSFLIFLLHPLLLSLLVVAGKRLGFPAVWTGNIGMLLEFLVTIILSIILTYVISLTPFSALIGGVKAVKKKEQKITATH